MQFGPVAVQDAGSPIPETVPQDSVVVYHTHGYRQMIGTCKFHFKIDCPHLRHWKPGSVLGGRAQLAKVLMRELVKKSHLTQYNRCGTCAKVK